jgi:hypothetical protein
LVIWRHCDDENGYREIKVKKVLERNEFYFVCEEMDGKKDSILSSNLYTRGG